MRIAAAAAACAALATGLAAEPRPACPVTRDGALCLFRDTPVELDTGEEHFFGDTGMPYYRMRRALTFTDGTGRTWRAPAGTLTDGASIPPVFHDLIGPPRTPEFLQAAAIHDAYCGMGNETLETFHLHGWEDVHRMFYDALVSSETGRVRAKIMFAAVYLAGPRWDDPAREIEVAADRLLQEMEWCIRWIEAKAPPRERIVEWMRSREPILTGPDHTPPDFDALMAETFD